MELLGKKKKKIGPVTGAASPTVNVNKPSLSLDFSEIFEKGYSPVVEMNPFGEMVMFTDGVASMDEPKKKWWEQQGRDRGVMITPTGSRIFYCQSNTKDSLEIQNARYPDVLVQHIGNKLHSVYIWSDNSWKYVGCPSSSQNLCKGKEECPHVEYMKECDGNYYVDECLTNTKGNCIIANNLRSEVEDLELQLEQKEMEIKELKQKLIHSSTPTSNLIVKPEVGDLDADDVEGCEVDFIGTPQLCMFMPDHGQFDDSEVDELDDFLKHTPFKASTIEPGDDWDVELENSIGELWWTKAKYLKITKEKVPFGFEEEDEVVFTEFGNHVFMSESDARRYAHLLKDNTFYVDSTDEGDEWDVMVELDDSDLGYVNFWTSSRFLKKS